MKELWIYRLIAILSLASILPTVLFFIDHPYSEHIIFFSLMAVLLYIFSMVLLYIFSMVRHDSMVLHGETAKWRAEEKVRL